MTFMYSGTTACWSERKEWKMTHSDTLKALIKVTLTLANFQISQILVWRHRFDSNRMRWHELFILDLCLSRRAGPPPSGHHQFAPLRCSLRPPSCQLQPGGPAGHRVATARGLKAGLVGADCCLIVLFRAAVPRLGRRRSSGGAGGGKWRLGGKGGVTGTGVGQRSQRMQHRRNPAW